VRVLFLTKYSNSGPSSRYRVGQFLPFLDRAGIEWRLHPLLDDRYLAARFAKRRPGVTYLARRAIGRVSALLRSHRYDVVFVQKEILPWVPPIVERLLEFGRHRVVLDIDDAIHLPYRGRPLLSSKIPRAIAGATTVLAGNRWLATYARGFNAHTVLFPTVVDTDRFTPATDRAAQKSVVGWIGSPETAKYLDIATPALRAVAATTPVRMRVIGAGALAGDGLAVETRPWSLDTEAAELRDLDVGIMPLADDEWARGKCSLKLLQYMSAGLATISSPRGSVPEILRVGDTGLVADSTDEWAARLGELLADPAAGRAMGARARAWMLDHYSLANYGPRFVAILESVAAGRGIADD
jgi:glycosyltransferase involved in cell wall biosynthesis